MNQANVTDATLKAIAAGPFAPKLTLLNLRASTLITDDGVEALTKSLRRVTVLDLSWCSELTGRSVDLVVAALPGLQVFNLRWCRKVPWTSILVLPNLRFLTSLNISHIAKGIAKLPELDLRSAQEYVQALCRMKTLTQLDIAGAYQHLHVLSLYVCVCLTEHRASVFDDARCGDIHYALVVRT